MSHLAAAARVLGQRRPAGAAAVLLGYLPASPDDSVTTAVLGALERVCLRDGLSPAESTGGCSSE